MNDSPNPDQQALCWEFLAQFAGRLAHDLSNIFTGVTGFSELALQQLSPDHSAASYLRDGIRTSQRGIELSRRLHQLHGSYIAERSSSSLAPIVDLARARLGQSVPAGVHLDFQLEEGLPIIAVGPELALSIVLELLRNAIEACGPLGSVAIAATAIELLAAESSGLIGRTSAGRHVELRIRDSGPGLPCSVRAEVGNSATSTKRAGHWGFGLAIVVRGLYACRGGLAFESAPGQGTVARVVLPVA